MGSTSEHDHIGGSNAPGDQFAGVADGGGLGQACDFGVWCRDGVVEGVGERAESAAEDDADGCGHSSIPAMHADMKFAMVPAATAFIPSLAKSDFRDGASA